MSSPGSRLDSRGVSMYVGAEVNDGGGGGVVVWGYL